jgi:hypothetical protein
MAATSDDVSRVALEPFVGEWRLMAAFESVPPADVGARVSFEWLAGEHFLVQRWEVPVPEAPDGGDLPRRRDVGARLRPHLHTGLEEVPWRG